MAAEESVYSALAALAGGRVHFGELPQGVTLPCLFCEREGSERQTSLNQVKVVTTIRLRIAAYADTLTAARTLADQVKTAMQALTVRNKLREDAFFRDPDTQVHAVTLTYQLWEIT